MSAPGTNDAEPAPEAVPEGGAAAGAAPAAEAAPAAAAEAAAEVAPGAAPPSRLVSGVVWLVAVALLLAVTTLPTLAWLPFVGGTAGGLVLMIVLAAPVGPAVAAALFAWRRWSQEPDLHPARHFWRGYRLNVVDSLRVWVPALVLLVVVGVNLANMLTSEEAPAAFRVVGMVVAVVIAVLAMHAMLVVSLFSFRARDIGRIAAFFLLTLPLSSLGALAIAAAAVAALLWGGLYLAVALAAPLTWLMWLNGRPVADEVSRRFVVGTPGVPLAQAVREAQESADPEDPEDPENTDSTPAP